MPVAIRAATRIQDMDDANVSLGVGVDEYALVYDHDTAKFVLRAPPDLSGYALLAGRAGGQTLYGGTAANDDITIHGTSNATRTTSYVILQPTAGFVGIGTSTPTQLLSVAGAISRGISSASLAIYGGNDYTDSGYFQVYGLTGGSTVDQRGGAEFVIRDTATFKIISYDGSAWTDKFTIRGTGNVGIGTTTPATALHVVGAATITAGIRPAADSTTALQLQNVAGTNVLNIDTTNARVGIGTTSPSYRLSVKGSSFVFDGVASFGMHGLYDGVNADYSSYVQVGEDNTWTGYFSNNANFDGANYNFLYPGQVQAATRIALIPGGTIGFDVGIGSTNPIAWTRSVTILNSGNVGIGTTSPATRLDIDAGAMTMAEMTAPTGVADKAMLYTKDNGSGKTQLCCKLGDDVEVILATQS